MREKLYTGTMVENYQEQGVEARSVDYVVGTVTWFRSILASVGLSKPRWDPDAKKRWEEARQKGELGKMADAPPGFVRDFVRACMGAADRAK